MSAFLNGLQIAFLAVGVVLFYWLVLRPRMPRTVREPAFPPSAINKHAFLMFVFYVIAGMFAFGVMGSLLGSAFSLSPAAKKMMSAAGSQIGWILAVVAHWFEYEAKVALPAKAPRESFFSPRVVLSGIATFVISLPIVLGVTYLWRLLLSLVGIRPQPQDLIGMFTEANSPLLLAMMIILAVVLAPISEELVFRFGVFRHLRSRVPRIAAVVISSVVFSAMHFHPSGFAPLAMLAVILALAYERTGHIGTPIIAHALFNLNTLVLVLTGTVKVT